MGTHGRGRSRSKYATYAGRNDAFLSAASTSGLDSIARPSLGNRPTSSFPLRLRGALLALSLAIAPVVFADDSSVDASNEANNAKELAEASGEAPPITEEGASVPIESEPVAEPFTLLDETIAPGSIERLVLRSTESFSGSRVETPIVVIHGLKQGATLCIVAGVHGDEVNGVEVVRRTVASLDPAVLRGTVIAVPIANISAFRRGSRYLPDRRDLNRYFPGRPRGSSASRIAHTLFSEIVTKCEGVIDLHTGSFHRVNLHQLRANLSDEGTRSLAVAFGAGVIVNNAGQSGTLRRAATDVGIPAITVEAGEPLRFAEWHVVQALDGIERLLHALGMIEVEESRFVPNARTVAYLRTHWVRCDHGGILVSRVELGETVEPGDELGTISDPLSDRVVTLVAPHAGRVIGMARDQVVMPGFAAYHLGYNPRVLEPEKEGDVPSELIDTHAPTEMGVTVDPEGLDREERPE